MEQIGKRLPHLVTPPCHCHMQAVVTADFGVCPVAPGLKGLNEGAAFLRNGEIDDHGGASRQSSLELQEGPGQLAVPVWSGHLSGCESCTSAGPWANLMAAGNAGDAAF